MTSLRASRYALPALAISSLYSYPVWETTRAALSPLSAQFRNRGPDSNLLVAAILHTAAAALVLYVAAEISMRRKWVSTRLIDGALICAAIALLLVYLPGVVSGKPRVLALRIAVSAITLLLVSRTKYRGQFLSVGFAVVCSLALVPAFLVADGLFQFVQRQSIGEKAPFRVQHHGKSARRLIWVVLDEFDPGIAVTARPAGLKVPVLDRLLSTSVSGSSVDPAGHWTREVIPAYILGRRIEKVAPDGPSELRIWFADGSRSAFSHLPTIFDKAKQRGFHSAVTAWYNPVCRWLVNGSVDDCVWVPNADAFQSLRREEAGRRLGLAWALLQSFESAATFGTSWTRGEYSTARDQHLEAFNLIHESSLRQLAEPSFGLLFLHYNIPHPLGIYNSQKGKLDSSGPNTYLDNLVLTDQVLGELLRSATEQSQVERTAFLITSDHSFRPEVWNYRSTWQSEAPEVRAHPKDPRILFLFHVLGDTTRQVVTHKLNAVSGHELALAWLDGVVDGHVAAASWLRENPSKP